MTWGRKWDSFFYSKPTMAKALAEKEPGRRRLDLGSSWACPMLVPAVIAMLALGVFSQPEHFSMWIQK